MPKQRFWPPTIVFWLLLIGGFAWQGIPGAILVFIAFTAGGLGTIYNLVKSGAWVPSRWAERNARP